MHQLKDAPLPPPPQPHPQKNLDMKYSSYLCTILQSVMLHNCSQGIIVELVESLSPNI